MHKNDGAGHEDGNFVNEDPLTNRAATEVTADWLNAIQLEFAHVIGSASIALNKADNTQVLQAIQAHINAGVVNGFADNRLDSANGYIVFPGGFKLQWMTGVSVNGVINFINPIAFSSLFFGGSANESQASGWDFANWVTIWGVDSSSTTLTNTRVRVRKIVEDGPPEDASGIAGRVFIWGV